jgi:hypothetical protein
MNEYAVYLFTKYLGSTLANTEQEACFNVASNLDMDETRLTAVKTGNTVVIGTMIPVKSQIKPEIKAGLQLVDFED